MTEQKTLTFFEAIAEARKGAVIRGCDSDYAMVFRDYAMCYENGYKITLTAEVLDAKYVIITPAPKPKVKVALYAYHFADRPFPEISTYYYKDEKIFSGAFIGKGIKWFKRLDWSEMEVDE